MATSFLINVMAAVLRREFHKCIENLQEKITDTGTLSSETFSETMERFGDLRHMVQKVDDMFSPIVCLNLAISLGMLCGAIYVLARGEGTFFDGWHFLVFTSLGTLVIILIQAPELHNKVRPKYFLICSLICMRLLARSHCAIFPECDCVFYRMQWVV